MNAKKLMGVATAVVLGLCVVGQGWGGEIPLVAGPEQGTVTLIYDPADGNLMLFEFPDGTVGMTIYSSGGLFDPATALEGVLGDAYELSLSPSGFSTIDFGNVLPTGLSADAFHSTASIAGSFCFADGTTTGQFQLVVPPSPSEMLEHLIADTVLVNLANGIGNSLDAKLDSALNALDDINTNNDVAACNSLNAFINAVEAHRGDKITDGDADYLIAWAVAILEMLGCP